MGSGHVSFHNDMKRILIATSLLVALIFPINTPATAGDGILWIAPDNTSSYERSLFKLWVDADGNGCDTRAEVLIKEASVKPKVGAKCKLTGGTWISSYDGVTYKDASKLDIDHLVPLAEAWRSGAWEWDEQQRQDFANDLEQEWALNAVTASVNRSKGDKDISSWLPKKNLCAYLIGWASVKSRYQLSVDKAEALVINKYYKSCGLGHQTKERVVRNPVPTVTSTQGTTNSAVTYQISQVVIDLTTLKLGGILNLTFAMNTNDTEPQSPYCLIDGILNAMPATFVADARDGGKIWQCVSPIPIQPIEQSPSGRYAVQLLTVFTNNGQKDELRKVVANIDVVSAQSPSATKAPAVKYANCTAAKAAKVTPIKRATNPDLYAMNSGLDRDKDGIACE